MITRAPRGYSMWGSPVGRRLAGAMLAPAVLGLTLAGCTNPPAAPPATPEVTSPTPSATPSAASTATATPSPTPSVTTPAPDRVTIDITIAGGQVSPNGRKVAVQVGQQVVLNVTSDEHDEIHAHTSDNGFTLDVPAGETVTGSFTLTSPGSYEVESHHLEKTIVILNVR